MFWTPQFYYHKANYIGCISAEWKFRETSPTRSFPHWAPQTLLCSAHYRAVMILTGKGRTAKSGTIHAKNCFLELKGALELFTIHTPFKNKNPKTMIRKPEASFVPLKFSGSVSLILQHLSNVALFWCCKATAGTFWLRVLKEFWCSYSHFKNEE